MRDEGKIGPNIAMISIADGFGIDLSQAARKSFGDAGFKLAYDKSYPIGTQDLSPLIGEAQRSGADTFVAFSYPPDTMALTEQSKVASYAPKVMFLGVGVGFPMYPQRFGANADGIMSLGGWSKDNASTAAYAKKHEEMFKRGPDRWGSQIGYSSLQMLEQAIERVGKIDRAAIIKELQTGTFDTVLGKVKLVDQPDEGQLLADRPVAGRFLRRCRSAASGRRHADGAQGSPGSREFRQRTPDRQVSADAARSDAVRRDARWHVCTGRDGADAAIRRRPYHEPFLRELLIAAAFARSLVLLRPGAQPVARPAGRAARSPSH